MNRRDVFFAYLLVGVAIFASLNSRAADERRGDWTIHHSDEPGKLDFALIEHRHGGTSDHESSWPLSVFVGLDVSKPGRHDVKFVVTRDAGRFECDGFLENGDGTGFFRFIADAGYRRAMEVLGFNGIDDDKQYQMAAMDVSQAFAKEM